MSTTYIAVIANLLAQLLPKLGVVIGTEELTTTIQTIVLLGSGLWVLFRRYQQGDINLAGLKKPLTAA